MANINVKRVDLTKRYEDKDLLIAPRTILDQVAINGSHNPETGEDIPGIDNTPAFIYDGKKPKNLNDALKNLAENVKGSIGSSGILQIKRGPDGTPEDPDTSGIYTFPVATDTQLGIITKADVKQIADDEDDARDAKRPTVDNKVMTGVATDGTGEYYDLGTKLTAPSANKVFTGFKGGDINDPQWESIKTTVAPKPFTGTWTDPDTGETYGPDNIGLATSYIDTLTKNIKIYEDESLTPSPTNTYTGVRDDTAGTLTITIPKAEGKVKDVQINNTSIVDTDGNAKITVKDTYDAAGTDAISGKGVADALSDLELEETGGTDKIITMVKQEDGKVTATAKTAVEKVVTPATTNAYEYKIADASVKVELPKATDTDYGEILLDKDKIDSASTAKTDDPKLMTGKAIEDSLAVKKVNGNASIYAYNSTVPAVDNAIVLGAGATATAEGAVVVGSGASAASKNDVAIGAGAATAADGGIAIGENATAAATKAISMGLGAQARSESSIAIGTAAKSVKEAAIALGSNINTTNAGEIAVGQYNITYTDDDEVVATAFTIGDGDITKAHNLIEQKQNADLYIPGIGGFDGTNSSPYDYELDDEGNPKINNDGNPIKKVRPLQESIVEDVVYMKPKEDSGNTQTITGFEAVANVESMSGNLGGFTVYAPLPVIPDEPPTFHIENLPADYCGIAFGFIVPDDDNALAITEESDESYGPYPNPYDLEIPIAMMETMGMTYDLMKNALPTIGGQMCIYLFGPEDKVLATAASANITYEAETAKPIVDYVIESNVSEWIQSTTAGSEIPSKQSKYYDNFESYSTPKFHVKNASSLASFPSTDLLFQFVAYYNGSGMSLGYPHYVSDISDLDDFTLTCVEWTMLAGSLPPGVDIHEIGLRLVLSNGWSEELPDMTGITYDVIGQKKDDTPTEFESISIVKEHKGVLPFVEKIENDTDNYHVPNVKAVKQVRKEIEDEFVFVDGSGDKSIKSKAGAAVASGKYAFATQALEMEFDYDVVTTPSIASGNSSVAMIGGEASGNGSFAIQGGKANGLQSTAIGDNAKTSETYAVAIGVETQASGVCAIAIGSNNKASAMCSMAMGRSSEATKEYANALGYYAKAQGMYSTAIGKYVTVTNKNSMAVGLGNIEHSDSTYGSEDATLFAIGRGTDMGVNAQEITYDGKMYINGIGGYDGIASDSTKWGAYKKNADGTDYINPLTSKKEHEYYKPLQEVIELMDARIKYLEDIIDQLTQQRNPVEP